MRCSRGEILLIDSAGEKSSIDNQHVTGDKTGCVRGKEDSCAAEFIELAKAMHRSAEQKFASAVCAIEERRVQIGTKNSRGDGVHANA